MKAVKIAIVTLFFISACYDSSGRGTVESSSPIHVSSVSDQKLIPRVVPQKPAKTILQPSHYKNRVILKFQEGSAVRLRSGELISTNGTDLSAINKLLTNYPEASVKRRFQRTEVDLEEERQRAEQLGGKQLADLNLYYEITLSRDINIARFCDALNALSIVELATPASRPAPPPGEL